MRLIGKHLSLAQARGAGVVWGVLAIALGGVSWLAVVTWLAAGSWLGLVFPGFLIEASGHAGAVGLAGWPGTAAGIAPYWQVEAVGGRAVSSGAAAYAEAAAHPPGTPLTWTFETPGGERVERTVTTAIFGRWDLLQVFTSYWVSGLCHVALGALVLLLRPRDAAAWAHWWLCLALGVFMLVNFDVMSTHFLPVWVTNGATSAVAPAVMALALVFPRVRLTSRTRRALLALLAALACALTAGTAFGTGWLYAWSAWGMVLSAAGAMLVAIALWARDACATALSPGLRGQARTVMLGLAVAFVPAIATSLVAPVLGVATLGPDLAHSAFVAFPLAVAYAIVRHGAFDFRPVARSLLLYFFATALLAALYCGILAVGAALGGGQGPGLTAFVAALTVAMAFRPLHDRLKRQLDRLFLGDRLEAVQALERFVQRPELGSAALAADLVALLDRLLRPSWAAFWVGPVRMAASGAAPATPGGASESNAGGQRADGPGSGVIAAPICVHWPLEGGQEAVLALGPRETGIAYAASERATVALLAGHAAIALRGAQLQEERLAMRLTERVAEALAHEREALIRQVVHDVRTDIFNISLAAEVGRESPEAATEAFTSIERSAGRIEAFLAEKASIARDGRRSARTPVLAALDAVQLVVAPLLATRRQTLSLEATETEVPLSAIELGQVVLNLLTNASKFSPAGSTIRCEARRTDGWLTLTVADAGPGLPANFTPGGPSTTGGGLGLLNVSALVAGAGGLLSWRNAAAGAVFEVRLPEVEVDVHVAFSRDHARANSDPSG